MTTTSGKPMVNLTIDGKPVQVAPGTVVVDAAKTVDIEIPVFCYHAKLGPFGCCRMCLVEVEKMPKLTTACTLAAAEGMVVNTKTERVEKAQQGVLEFTLLNHPLDCPVCDKGGECPLQDNTFKFGPRDTRMVYDRFHRDKATPLSPVITIDRERCIACQRCTRYSEIIETDQALVMLNRGFRNLVATFNDEPYETRFSGNVIDICPVGALTNTDFRFTARSWDLKNAETTCGHCGCNCNMVLGTRVNAMKRVTSQQNANDFVDDGWICDKGRWGHDFTASRNRIAGARRRDSAAALTGREAAVQVAGGLKAIVDQHGPQAVGFIGSPYGLNEELYLYQKFFRLGLGTNNIDHKTYTDSPGLPAPHWDLLDLETAGLILLIGSDPAEELPILELRLKKAVTQLGVPLMILNDQQTGMDRFAQRSLRYHVGSDPAVLGALSGFLGGEVSVADPERTTGLAAADLKAVAERIRAAGRVAVVYNPAALTGNGVEVMKYLLSVLQGVEGVECGAIPAAPATNALGAMDMGILPDHYPGGLSLRETATIQERFGENAPLEAGLSALEMIDQARAGDLKALVVYRRNPIVDFPGGTGVEEALKKLDLLVVHDIMETETAGLAHYVIPSNGPGFDEGTTTNLGGRVQIRKRGLFSENPQDVKVLSWMLQEVGREAAYLNAWQVTKEIAAQVPAYQDMDRKSIGRQGKPRASVACSNRRTPQIQVAAPPANGALKLRVADFLFRHDKVLDAQSPLAHKFRPASAHLHPDDAARLGIREGETLEIRGGQGVVQAAAVISARCNPGAVVVPWVSDEQGLMGIVSRDGVSWVTVAK
ncbi:MAG: molybdopterin-dependent oxidoreductase [Nitrospinaceae bacterium]